MKEKVRTSCDSKGNIDSLIGTVCDITPFKKANLELQKERRRLQKAQELARLGWWIYEISEDESFWSDTLYEICGVNPQEYAGTYEAFRELVHPEDRPKLQQLNKKLQQTKQPIDYELRMYDENGDIIHLKNKIHGVRNRDGEIVRLMGVSQDITSQKEMQNELQKRSEAIASSMDGISIADAEGKFVYANKAQAYIYGFESADALIGKSWRALYHDDYVEYFKEQVMPVVNQEGYWRGEVQGKRKDGTTFPQELTLNKTSNGGIIGIVRDITKRKQSEAKLERLLREKRAMLEEIHHRVKNNLAIISGMLQLQVFETEDPKVETVLNDSQLRVQSIALVHEMLYESETLADISFKEFIKKLLKSIKATLAFDHQHISVELYIQDVELGIKQAIPTAILINELVTNAYKHAFIEKQTGTITVELEKAGQSISLIVRDNGQGLPDDFALEEQSSIGMDLAQTLTQQLDGELTHASNGGARFQVDFKKEIDSTH